MTIWHPGAKLNIVFMPGAQQSLEHAEAGIPDNQRSCKARMRRLLERLGDFRQLNSPDELRHEGSQIYAIKTWCGLRAYGWFAKDAEVTSLKNWLKSSEGNRRLFAQEGLLLDVSETIWRALNERGLSKAELAKALDTSKANVTQLLNGRRNMTLRTLADMAFALGLEVKVELCEPREHGSLDANIRNRQRGSLKQR